MYPENKISELSYFDVKYITDEDWSSLMKISKSFNYLEPKQDIDPKIKKVYAGGGLTPWKDFNNQTGIWSVISDDFTVVRDFAQNAQNKQGAKGLSSANATTVCKKPERCQSTRSGHNIVRVLRLFFVARKVD